MAPGTARKVSSTPQNQPAAKVAACMLAGSLPAAASSLPFIVRVWLLEISGLLATGVAWVMGLSSFLVASATGADGCLWVSVCLVTGEVSGFFAGSSA